MNIFRHCSAALVAIMLMAGAAHAGTISIQGSSYDLFAAFVNANGTPRFPNHMTGGVEIALTCDYTGCDQNRDGVGYSCYDFTTKVASCVTGPKTWPSFPNGDQAKYVGATGFGTCATSASFNQVHTTYGTTHYEDLKGCRVVLGSMFLEANNKIRDQIVMTTTQMGYWDATTMVSSSFTVAARVDGAIPDAAETLYTGVNRVRTYGGQTTITQGRADLFLSPDGVYDHPIIIPDGMDPLNTRNAYEMFADLSQIGGLMVGYGIDVWFVNYADGRASLREHADDTAILTHSISSLPHQGVYRTTIDLMIGVSEGGNAGRYALAMMEFEQASGWIIPDMTDPAGRVWTFAYDDSAARRAYGNPVRAFVAWDSPFGDPRNVGMSGGASAMPIEMQLMARKIMSLTVQDAIDFCKPRLKFWAKLAVGVITVASSLISPLAPLSLISMGAVALPWMLSMQVSLAGSFETFVGAHLDAGAMYDQVDTFCTSTSRSSCTTAYRTDFIDDMKVFNGDGWPRSSRRFAFSQGTWDSQRCRWPDQWGAKTCAGPGKSFTWDDPQDDKFNELVSGFASATYASPDMATNQPFASGTTFATFTPDSSTFGMDWLAKCTNTISLPLEPRDLVAGSTTDLLLEGFAKVPDADKWIKFNVLPGYQPITSSLHMYSASDTRGTPFNEVTWQPYYAFTHQNISPWTLQFLIRIVEEYTVGDKDGLLTCRTDPASMLYAPVINGVSQSTGFGKLCSCDPQDGVVNTPTCSALSGVLPPVRTAPTVPVYRFYKNGDHFQTLSYSEGVNGGYTYEGVSFRVFDAAYTQPAGTQALYRCTYSGKHMVSLQSNCEGATYEGKYGYVFTTARSDAQQIWRYYIGSDHVTSASPSEGGMIKEGTQGYAPL